MVKIRKNLVFLYSEDSRIKIKEIASLLNKSSQRIKYSLKVMDKEGITKNPFCVFDYSYFGLLLFRVYFKGAYISEKDKSDIIQKLSENDHVAAVYELSGEFDLVIEIQAPNPSQFNKVLKGISNLIPTLRHYKIILNVVTYLYPRMYLTKEESLHSRFHHQVLIGGDREPKIFNDNEKAIMKVLLANPKSRMTSLAKQSNLNIKTAKLVFHNLLKKNVIKGFKCLVDTNKLNINKFRLFLKLHNLSKEREEELMNYLAKTKEFVQAHKTVGDWDLELDIESMDKIRIRQITIEIRELFKDIIGNFNMMEFYQQYSRSYLPKYLFEMQKS